MDCRHTGKGEVVVEDDAPGAGEDEFGSVLEGETPGGIGICGGGMEIEGSAEFSDELFGNKIGFCGRCFLNQART